MEVAQVVQVPVDVLKSMVNDTQSDVQMEVTPEAAHNNHAHPNIPSECVKVPEPELVLNSPAEESRPVSVAVAPSSSNGETDLPVSPNTSGSSEGAEVVTPAGTVEAPLDTEVVEKEAIAHVKKANESETPAEHETQQEEQPKVGQQETVASVPPLASTEPTPEVASAPSPGKKTKVEKRHASNNSFASEEVLSEVQAFLTLQVVENRCNSHTKEIHEFMEKHLNEKQQKRYIAPLLERIMQHLTQEATAKGEEVSVDLQSNICLIEQMFLTLGRRSPLEDMYTAEEEEMLDLLFHSNSSDNLLTNN